MSRNQPDVQYSKVDGRVLQDAGFLSSEEKISPDLTERNAIARPKFTVEWGERKSDSALVIHLYPHLDGDNVATVWDESFQMDKRLDVAIPEVFDKKSVHAGFEPAFNSFFIIVHHLIVPDLRLLVQRFLEKIEGASPTR